MKYLWNGADKAWLPKNPAAASAQEHFRIKISVTANAVTDSGMRITSKVARLCLAVILYFVACPGKAATRYVALDGNNSSGSSWANAYTSLYAAVNASASGDTILIKQGRYCNTNSAAIFAKSLTISGGYFGETPLPGNFTNDPAATILDACGTNRVITILNCTTGMIERVTICNGYNTYGAGVFVTNSIITITNANIEGNVMPYNGQGGGLYMNNGQINLLRCKIRNNYVKNSSNGGGIYQDGGFLNIANSWLIGNSATAQGARQGAALHVVNAASNTRLFNSLIACNYTEGNGGVVSLASGNMTILNCTVAGNSPYGIQNSGGALSVADTILWNNGDDISGVIAVSYSCVRNPNITGPGVIHDDPCLTNGFRLPHESPCIDGGSDSAINFGLNAAYTELGVPDSGVVDMGYHYPAACDMLDLHVSSLGTDDPLHGSAPGTDAFRSLTYALTQARDDTRINIEPACYDNATETFPIKIPFNNVQLIGAGATQTIFSAKDAGASVLRATNVFGLFIRGLSLRDAQPPAYVLGGGAAFVGCDVVIEDCETRNNTCVNNSHGAGLYMYGGAVSLLRCKVRNNIVAASSSGSGIYRSCSQLSIADSVVSNNRNNSGGYGAGSAIYATGYGSAQIKNTLFACNHGYSGAITVDNGNVTLCNATVAHNSHAGLNRRGGVLAASNSIIWANGTDVTGIVDIAFSCVGDTNQFGPGIIYNDPLFAARYHIAENSPCIDAGGDTAEHLGLDNAYAEENETDTGIVDLGYHYPTHYASCRRFVSPLGADDPGHGTGPGANAYRSITYAISKIPENTHLLIEEGVYNSAVETFPLTLEGRNSIHLIGAGRTLTTLNATNTGKRALLITNALDITVSNLTVTGGNGGFGSGIAVYDSKADIAYADVRHNTMLNQYFTYGAGVFENASHVNLLRCKIRNNFASGSVYGGGLAGQYGNFVVKESAIYDNTVPANRYGGGIYTENMGLLHLNNTLVVRNSAENASSGGIYTIGGIATVFTNCTIADNQYGGYFCQSAGARLWNSIIWGNGVDLTGSVTAAYCCFENAYNIADLIGNVRAHPQWVDMNYYHLKSTLGQYQGGFFDGGNFVGGPETSPLIDAGDPQDDYNREPRPSLGIEIGAYGNSGTASLSPVVGTMILME